MEKLECPAREDKSGTSICSGAQSNYSCWVKMGVVLSSCVHQGLCAGLPQVPWSADGPVPL